MIGTYRILKALDCGQEPYVYRKDDLNQLFDKFHEYKLIVNYRITQALQLLVGAVYIGICYRRLMAGTPQP